MLYIAADLSDDFFRGDFTVTRKEMSLEDAKVLVQKRKKTSMVVVHVRDAEWLRALGLTWVLSAWKITLRPDDEVLVINEKRIANNRIVLWQARRENYDDLDRLAYQRE